MIATLVQCLGRDNSSTNRKRMHNIYFLTESMIFTSFLKLFAKQLLQVSFWYKSVIVPHSLQVLNSLFLACGSVAISISVSHSSILFLPNKAGLIDSAVHNLVRSVSNTNQKHYDEVTVYKITCLGSKKISHYSQKVENFFFRKFFKSVQ